MRLTPVGLRHPAGHLLLRAGGARQGLSSYGTPSRVPAGTYVVWANFGAGPQEAGQVDVPDQGEIVIRCNAVRGTCGR